MRFAVCFLFVIFAAGCGVKGIVKDVYKINTYRDGPASTQPAYPNYRPMIVTNGVRERFIVTPARTWKTDKNGEWKQSVELKVEHLPRADIFE